MRASRWLVFAITLAACAAHGAHVAPQSTPATAAASGSNVLRSDYAGSRACAGCHAEIYAAWAASPMARMTRDASVADVHAPFSSGAELRVGGDVARLEQRGAARFVTLENAKGALTRFRVTKILGGRTREDFVGVAVDAPDGAPRGDEQVLPVSYLLFGDRLRYKGYSVMVHERRALEAGPAWDRTCILCHNTAPYFTTLLGALAGRHAKPYQAALVDATLPRDRAQAVRVTDEAAFERALAGELGALGREASGDASADIVRAIDATRDRFGARDLIELGVGCEACHGGAAAHARDPSTLPTFVPTAPFVAVEPKPSRAVSETRVCARCHEVLFSKYPWTWEGGARHENPGGSHISSGEGRDFLLGGCASAMTCTACHDPHAKDDAGKLATMYTPAGNGVCLGCHAELRGGDALRAHAHHDPAGAGGACMACHMPKKNMTLDLRLGGYHRIGSPTDPERVVGDRPLECALCHADESSESLAATMERWWNKRYDRALLTKLYGDLSAPAMRATLERGKPHEKAVALWVLGERRDAGAALTIARETVNEYPLVRQYAKDALEKVLGRPCAVDVAESAQSVEQSVRGCLRAAGVEAARGAWRADGGASEEIEPAED